MNRTFLAVIAFVAFWTLALVGSYTRSIVDARREARRYNKTTTFLTQSFKYAASSKKSQRNAKTNTQNVGVGKYFKNVLTYSLSVYQYICISIQVCRTQKQK